MPKKIPSWTFCPVCSELLIVSAIAGHSRSFPLGPKGKSLISALVAERLSNEKFSPTAQRLIDELNNHPATIKLNPKPKRGRPPTGA